MDKKLVSELECYELDYWVALANGWRKQILDDGSFEWRADPYENHEYSLVVASSDWSPSTEWEDGGEIIEFECIEIMVAIDSKEFIWKARCLSKDESNSVECYGNSPLIAAMRAFVVSNIGEYVDIE
jgi:hypothetical protein